MHCLCCGGASDEQEGARHQPQLERRVVDTSARGRDGPRATSARKATKLNVSRPLQRENRMPSRVLQRVYVRRDMRAGRVVEVDNSRVELMLQSADAECAEAREEPHDKRRYRRHTLRCYLALGEVEVDAVLDHLAPVLEHRVTRPKQIGAQFALCL